MKVRFLRSPVSYLRSHYHWVVAAAVLFMIFVHGGAGNNLSGLHIVPITQDLGISRAAFSLALSAKGIIGTAMTFFSGFFFARFGFRKTAVFGMALCAMSYLVLSAAENTMGLFLGGVLVGFGNCFCTTAGATKIISDWFHKHKGTVLGLVTSASGIGGSVVCLVQTAAMERFSWRGSLITAALLIFVGGLLILILVRNRPAEKGLVPLGDGEEVLGKRRRSVENVRAGHPMKELWREPTFLLMLPTVFLAGFATYMVFSVIVAYFKGECGFPAATASGLQSFMLLFLTATKLLAGFLCDHLGTRRTTSLFLLCGAAGILLLPFAGNTPLAVLAIALYTLGLPIVSVLPPLLSLTTFGFRAQAQYTGIFLGLIAGSNFAADFASNLIFDVTGSYRPAFFAAAGILVLVVLLFLLIFRLTDRKTAACGAGIS